MLWNDNERLPETDYNIGTGQQGGEWGGRGEMNMYYQKMGLKDGASWLQGILPSL